MNTSPYLRLIAFARSNIRGNHHVLISAAVVVLLICSWSLAAALDGYELADNSFETAIDEYQGLKHLSMTYRHIQDELNNQQRAYPLPHSTTLTVFITAKADVFDLEIESLATQGPERIEINLSDAKFDVLLRFIYSIEENKVFSITKLKVVRSKNSGYVDARLMFSYRGKV